MSKSTLIDAFLKLQATDHSNIFEAAKKAKKDWDGDGKVESGKDEYLGSKIAAAKKAGKMEEELKGDQDKIDANENGKIDSDDFKKLRSEKKSAKMKAYRDDRDKHGEMEEGNDPYLKNLPPINLTGGNQDRTNELARMAGSQPTQTTAPTAADRAAAVNLESGGKKKMKEEVEQIMDEATDPRDSRPETYRTNNTGYAWDKLATRSPSSSKDSKATKSGKQLGLKNNIKRDLGSHGPKGVLPEEVGFSEAELAHFEAVIARKDQKGKEKGMGDVVDSADLTDEYINEMAARGVKAGTKRGSYKKKATDLQGNRAASADVGGDEGSKGVPHVLDQIRHGHEDEHGFKTITHPASSPEAPVTKKIHRSELHGFYDKYHNTEKPAAKEKEYSSFLGKHFGDERSSAPTHKSVTTDLSKVEKSNLKGGGAKPTLGGSKLVGGKK